MLPVQFCFVILNTKYVKNRCCCYFLLGYMNDNEIFVRFTVRAFVNVYQFVCVILSLFVLRVGCKI